MKKQASITFFLLMGTITFAQSKFTIGPSYTMGLTSIYGSTMSTSMSGMNMGTTMNNTDYGAKMSIGAGLRSEYFLSEKMGIILDAGYMQRGAMFDMNMADYSPRYRFSYFDIKLGAKYKSKELIGKSKLFFSLGGSQHTLIEGYRLNSYNAVNILDDVQMVDWGAFVGLGVDIPVQGVNILQLQLLANSGFKNVFGGVLEMNGLQGKNILYGLQISYLFGLKKKESDINIENNIK